MRREIARVFYRVRYFQYLLASALSLGADFAAFLLLLQMRFAAVLASVAAYSLGLGIHWLISSRVVFAREVAVERSQRLRQKLLFVASAVAGLAVTAVVINWGIQWKLDPSLSKLLAVGLSFQVTYFLRRTIVFACPDRE